MMTFSRRRGGEWSGSAPELEESPGERPGVRIEVSEAEGVEAGVGERLRRLSFGWRLLAFSHSASTP